MANDLLNALVARWKFDTTGDKEDFGPTGDFPFVHESGAVLVSDGFRDFAVHFGTDTSNRLRIADTVAKRFAFGDNSFTVAQIVRAHKDFNHPYLARWTANPSGNLSWLLWNRSTNDSHRFSISAAGLIEETIVEVANPDTQTVWQLIVAGYDKDAGHIFISRNGGAKVTTAHSGGAFADAASNVTTGWFEGSTGKIMGFHDGDEGAIWERALTAQDITDYYNGGDILAFDDWDRAQLPMGLAPQQFRYQWIGG